MEPVIVVTGTAVPLDRSDVDTDQIIPSDWLKRVERTGFGAGLFSEWRDDRDFVLNSEHYTGANILVAGPNFGTGSSREHAVWAIMDYGFQAVISPRFADIFRNNCTKNGLVPVQVDPEVGAQLLRAVEADPALEITIDIAARTV
jgi:3-isopropylmalate/(R)-2-methylmalate dehydratase small subunit